MSYTTYQPSGVVPGKAYLRAAAAIAATLPLALLYAWLNVRLPAVVNVILAFGFALAMASFVKSACAKGHVRSPRWAGRFGLLLGNVRAKLVEAQQVAQHAQKTRVDQVGALGKHRAEVGAAPLQGAAAAQRCWHLHRKRHVRRGRLHAQLGKQTDQVRVGPLVEDQEAGVHAVRDAPERHVHRVRMAAEARIRLEQRHLHIPQLAQLPSRAQAGDARADDGDARHRRTPAQAGPGRRTEQRRFMDDPGQNVNCVVQIINRIVQFVHATVTAGLQFAHGSTLLP